MRIALVCIKAPREKSERPEEQVSRYTVRPGTLGQTLFEEDLHHHLAFIAMNIGTTLHLRVEERVLWKALPGDVCNGSLLPIRTTSLSRQFQSESHCFAKLI